MWECERQSFRENEEEEVKKKWQAWKAGKGEREMRKRTGRECRGSKSNFNPNPLSSSSGAEQLV
jgi:hypothetical protein